MENHEKSKNTCLNCKYHAPTADNYECYLLCRHYAPKVDIEWIEERVFGRL